MQCARARVEASIAFKELSCSVFYTMYRIYRSISRALKPSLTCAIRRVQVMLQIFHKPNKLVGVVKCTDCVVVKWESDDQVNEIYNLF